MQAVPHVARAGESAAILDQGSVAACHAQNKKIQTDYLVYGRNNICNLSIPVLIAHNTKQICIYIHVPKYSQNGL